ncbi:hypothetical protein EON66_09400 [archaeon]|nr:MAG: hypothetical protein EON66_09400 [archaeon]
MFNFYPDVTPDTSSPRWRQVFVRASHIHACIHIILHTTSQVRGVSTYVQPSSSSSLPISLKTELSSVSSAAAAVRGVGGAHTSGSLTLSASKASECLLMS